MNIHDYLRGCLRTWDGKNREIRAVLGLVGEAGEVAEKYKKYMRRDYREQAIREFKEENLYYDSKDIREHTKYIFKDAIKKELGDVIYYWTILCHELGLDPAEVMRANLEKLAKRKAEGKIKGDGDESYY